MIFYALFVLIILLGMGGSICVIKTEKNKPEKELSAEDFEIIEITEN